MMNVRPLGFDAYKNISLGEAAYSDIRIDNEYDSFHLESCIKCRFNNRTLNLKPRAEYTERQKVVYDELMQLIAKGYGPKRRAMILTKGKYMWHFVCEKCHVVEKESDDIKKIDFKAAVKSFLGEK